MMKIVAKCNKGNKYNQTCESNQLLNDQYRSLSTKSKNNSIKYLQIVVIMMAMKYDSHQGMKSIAK